MSPSAPLPVVSVILATRDRPEMLRTAVRSVLAQDCDGGIEVLVVYDQATPDSTLAHELTSPTRPDRTVRVLANTRTPGLPGARNCGLLAAQAPWVAFCDDVSTAGAPRSCPASSPSWSGSMSAPQSLASASPTETRSANAWSGVNG